MNDFKDFKNLYKRYTRKPYSVLVIDTTLHQIILYVSDRIFYKKYKKLIISIIYQIRDEKLDYDINKKAAKLSGYKSIFPQTT